MWEIRRPLFTRHPENPVVVPGVYDWRAAVTFNPGALHENGKFYLYERTAGSCCSPRKTRTRNAGDGNADCAD